ncbi:MAG: glycoside hydrolase family 99-like domain-containing protein, partial [Planctomycetota bacterium]
EGVREAVLRAKRVTLDRGLGELHLAAIDPSPEWAPQLRTLGFDSVTHYVHLPQWKGPPLQDYRTSAKARAAEWPDFAERTELPYLPSVATGWDATPRAADFGPKRPDKYPWSPVVTGDSPKLFEEALLRARRFAAEASIDDPLTFIASLNEWTEGHYLEPDERFGTGMLEALSSSV